MATPRVWIVAASVCLAGLLVAAPAGGAPSLQDNQRAARADAIAHLNALRLPADAQPSPSEPKGDGGMLKPMSPLIATTAEADAHGWWTAPETPDSVLSYVESHRPAGGSQAASGSGCSHICSESVQYAWPAISGVIGFRGMWVTVVALRGGGTGVLAAAGSEWIVPRPAAEKIPAGVRTVGITSRKLRGPVTSSVTVTGRGQVRKLVAIFDAMPIAQPLTIACPALWSGPSARLITFTFLARSGALPLARASYFDGGPSFGSSSECNAISFTVRGRQQPPLIGGEFLKHVDAIVGANLSR